MPYLARDGCRCPECVNAFALGGNGGGSYATRDNGTIYAGGAVPGQFYAVGGGGGGAGWQVAADPTYRYEVLYDNAEEYARACAEVASARALARERSEQVLLRWLSPEQQADYQATRSFEVAGSDGGRWQIVCEGQTGNVRALDADGVWTHAFCGHPRSLPDPEAWLAQAMAVAHDAPGFVAAANLYNRNRNVAPQVPVHGIPARDPASPARDPGARLRFLHRGGY